MLEQPYPLNRRAPWVVVEDMKSIVFKPVEVTDRDAITDYTLRGSSMVCDLAFSNLYGWAVRYGTSWAIIEGSLVIRFKPAGRNHPAYLMPLCDSGEGFVRTIHRLRALAQEGDYPLILMGVASRCRERLESLCPEAFQFLGDEGNQDYIYLRERLVSLSGKSLQSKRNHINKFERLYPDYTYEPLTSAHADECLSLVDTWLDASGDGDGRLDERLMIERTLKHAEALGLTGGILRVEGKIVAFSYGSPINADTFGIHVEKADTAYEGAFTMINRELARHIPEQYTYINREEDLGIEGLRKSKLSYKPEMLLAKETAILRYDLCDESN